MSDRAERASTGSASECSIGERPWAAAARRPPASTNATLPNDGTDGTRGGQPAGKHRQGTPRRHGICFQQRFEAAARNVLDHRDARGIQRPGPVREQNLRTADARGRQPTGRGLERGEAGRVRERIGRILGTCWKHPCQ